MEDNLQLVGEDNPTVEGDIQIVVDIQIAEDSLIVEEDIQIVVSDSLVVVDNLQMKWWQGGSCWKQVVGGILIVVDSWVVS